jgi:hypothetical protein
MAEAQEAASDAASDSSSMWSFVSTVTSALDVLKKDLGEFQTTVRDDTQDATAKTIETVQEKVSKTVDSVQSGVSTTIETINRSVDGEDFEEALMKIGQ